MLPSVVQKIFFQKKNFWKKNFFQKKNFENSDPPSLETLLKSKNLFFTIKKSVFWYTNSRKLVTMVIWHRHQSTLRKVLETSSRGFFDIWTKTKVILSQKLHFRILEKQQNKLKSCIYDGISHEQIWKSRYPLVKD